MDTGDDEYGRVTRRVNANNRDNPVSGWRNLVSAYLKTCVFVAVSILLLALIN